VSGPYPAAGVGIVLPDPGVRRRTGEAQGLEWVAAAQTKGASKNRICRMMRNEYATVSRAKHRV
jgi:hypothetical protein